MPHQKAKLDWRDGRIPVSETFDDPYFSLENGLEETRHVFLSGNNLPDRFEPGFHIAELGFGTGLNALTAWAAWEEADVNGALRFTSFEAYPMAAEDMARALMAFPQLVRWSERLLDRWTGPGRYDLGTLELEVIHGDARDALPKWDGQADAWFLDGFSPAKNPELWQPDLMVQVALHTRPSGTVATYTAAGFVRRALAEAGLTVSRTSGYGRKRHMTRAAKP